MPIAHALMKDYSCKDTPGAILLVNKKKTLERDEGRGAKREWVRERGRGRGWRGESFTGGRDGDCFVAPEACDTTRVLTASQWELFEG